jgi:hypothetical protein
MARYPAGKLTMTSSHQVAEERLPCRKSTGSPLSGPARSTRVRKRRVQTRSALTPGKVAMAARFMARLL